MDKAVSKENLSLALQENNRHIAINLTDRLALKADAVDLAAHIANTDNVHAVTKAQVGLGNVPNVTTNDQTPTFTTATTLTTLTSGEKLTTAFGKIAYAISNLIGHMANTSNPHTVTKTQVSLGNVPNVTTNNQTPTYTNASSVSELSSGETLTIAFGKIAKAISDYITHKSTSASTTVSGHVMFGTSSTTACVGNDSRLSNSRTPTAHASTATTYGIGTGSNYGHVKLSDSVSSTSAASAGIAASPAAVRTAYNLANTANTTANAAVPKANISRSTSLTTTGTYALDAVEKNASVSGTLANSINSLNNTISGRNFHNIGFFTGNIDSVGGTGGLPSGNTHAWVSSTQATGTFPYSGTYWAVLETVAASALLQTMTVYGGALFTRVYANSAWTAWIQFATLTDVNAVTSNLVQRTTRYHYRVYNAASVKNAVRVNTKIPCSGLLCATNGSSSYFQQYNGGIRCVKNCWVVVNAYIQITSSGTAGYSHCALFRDSSELLTCGHCHMGWDANLRLSHYETTLTVGQTLYLYLYGDMISTAYTGARTGIDVTWLQDV